jgi:hypothetical protein
MGAEQVLYKTVKDRSTQHKTKQHLCHVKQLLYKTQINTTQDKTTLDKLLWY